MINNKIGGHNMVGRAVNRLAGRLTAVALTAAMAVSMLAGCAAGGKNTETAAKKEYKPSAMEQMNAKNDPNVIQDNYRTCYEVFVYSFFDSDGDGIGDLKGLTEKLDYIEGLGCNEIWMMPIMPSPSYHKYDITDYMNIDKQYGTLDDFDALITECHKRNINVIIDFVMNHTSNEHHTVPIRGLRRLLIISSRFLMGQSRILRNVLMWITIILAKPMPEATTGCRARIGITSHSL